MCETDAVGHYVLSYELIVKFKLVEGFQLFAVELFFTLNVGFFFFDHLLQASVLAFKADVCVVKGVTVLDGKSLGRRRVG